MDPQLLDKISDVFRQYGYEGATLTRLSEATGLKRGSLYHHFPGGKEEMAKAVLHARGDAARQQLFAPLQSQAPIEQRLQSWAQAVIVFYSQGDKNCMLGAMVLGGGLERFHDQLSQGFRRWIDKLSAVLIEAGIAEKEAQQRARQAVEKIQGSLIVNRALGESEQFRQDMLALPEFLLRGR